MPTIDIGEVEMFFTDSGRGPEQDTPPLLLIHGWTCDSNDWVFQIPAFGDRHRVIAADLRGHGSSSAPASDYTAQRYAADLAALLQELGVGQVVAIGHSLGGSVAAALAVEHPTLVRATVTVEPAYGQGEEALKWLQGAGEQFGDEDGSELAARLVRATEPNTPEWLRLWHGRRLLGMRPALLRQTFWDMYCCDTQISGQPRSDAYLAGRNCPTLAFHRFPAMAAWEQTVMRHPYSKVVSWEGAGHWLHQERVADFNALVLSWIAGLPEPVLPQPESSQAELSGELVSAASGEIG